MAARKDAPPAADDDTPDISGDALTKLNEDAAAAAVAAELAAQPADDADD